MSSSKLRSSKPLTRGVSKIKTTSTTDGTSKNKRFVTTSSNKSSPFKAFITTGGRVRRGAQDELNDFAYDLSKDELNFMRDVQSPMKTVPDDQRELLKTGQRQAYLALRYEHSPNHKYNYPQATSWRIGWLHNKQMVN